MVAPPPRGCSARARAFWRDYQADGRALSALEQALLVEAVRLMSRADQMDRELGQADAEERRSLLVEARLTATALKGVVAELRQHNAGGRALAGGAGPAGPDDAVEKPKAVDPVDELNARRAQRRADAAGGAPPAVPE